MNLGIKTKRTYSKYSCYTGADRGKINESHIIAKRVSRETNNAFFNILFFIAFETACATQVADAPVQKPHYNNTNMNLCPKTLTEKERKSENVNAFDMLAFSHRFNNNN